MTKKEEKPKIHKRSKTKVGKPKPRKPTKNIGKVEGKPVAKVEKIGSMTVTEAPKPKAKAKAKATPKPKVKVETMNMDYKSNKKLIAAIVFIVLAVVVYAVATKDEAEASIPAVEANL